MTAAADRTATAVVAEDLPAARATAGAGCGSDAGSRSIAACRFARRTAGLTTLAGGTLFAVVTLGRCRLGRLGGALLLAFIVVVDRITLAADDLAALVAVDLEAVLA